MLLSSGVIWRHRTLDEFRAECPGGDPSLQSRIVEELDDALDWLERLGIEPVRRETGNPLTLGRRYDPRALTDTLVRAAGDVRLRAAVRRGAGARDRRLRSAAGAGARAAAAGRAVERGRRARVRARPRRGDDGGDGGVLRPRAARPRSARTTSCARRSSTRGTRSCSTTRAAISATRPGTRATSSSGFPAGRAWYVVDAPGAAAAGAGADGGRPRRGRAAAGGDVRPAERAAVRAAGVAEARRAAVPGGAGLRGRDAHDRRHPDRRPGAGARRRRLADPGPLRGGRRRGRHLHRRLRQRPRRRARLRPHRRRDRARASSWCGRRCGHRQACPRAGSSHSASRGRRELRR